MSLVKSSVNLIRWAWRAAPVSTPLRISVGKILIRSGIIVDPNPPESRLPVSLPPSSFRARSCLIVCTSHTDFIAACIRKELTDLGFSAQIARDATHAKQFEYCFVIAPHMFSKLPKGYIGFQVEQLQHSAWNTRKYRSILDRAACVVDYSIDNIKTMRSWGVSYGRLFFVPLDICSSYGGEYRAIDIKNNIDVLFYGSINESRRKRILEALRLRANITVVTNKFGAELHALVRSARVVLNVHYYDNARLEATRIYEALSLGAHVISEDTDDTPQYPDLDGVVDFVKAGDIDAMLERIESRLRTPSLTLRELESRPSRFAAYFRRFMLARNLISFECFSETALGFAPKLTSVPRICLSLPETPERREAFLAVNDGFILFDGIRFSPAWRGCGLSYKYLFQHLQNASVSRCIICEDDAVLGADHEERFAKIITYLDQHEGEWDVFSGFIADIHPEAVIDRVESSAGETFVWIDRATSTVFNVYSSRAIEILAAWDMDKGAANSNTLDRYMERAALRFVTTTPFLVGHSEEQRSTLWGDRHAGYGEMTRRTNRILTEKLSAW